MLLLWLLLLLVLFPTSCSDQWKRDVAFEDGLVGKEENVGLMWRPQLVVVGGGSRGEWEVNGGKWKATEGGVSEIETVRE